MAIFHRKFLVFWYSGIHLHFGRAPVASAFLVMIISTKILLPLLTCSRASNPCMCQYCCSQ